MPDNGDQNPYAIVVAPVTTGKLQQGDVLVDNFNDRNNLQGLGSTIVYYRPGQISSACSPQSRATCRNARAASG